MKRTSLRIALFGGLSVAVLFAAQINGYFDFFQITAPGNPPAGQTRTFVDATQKIFYDLTDGGVKHHTVATSSCSGGTPVVGNINNDGSVTCAAGGGSGNTTTLAACATYPPSTAGHSTGDIYKCTDSEYQLIFNGSIWVPSTDGIVVTRPDISTFTNFGSVPDASDNTRGPFMMQRLYGAGYNWTEFTKAIPAGSSYTITLGFRMRFNQEPSDQAYAAIVLRLNSTGQFWAYGWGRESGDLGGDAILFFTNPTTFGGSNPLTAPLSSRWSDGRTIFIRVQADGTNWNYYSGWGLAIDPTSTSTTNWLLRATRPENETITPDQVGFGMTMKDSALIEQMEVVHFSATAP